MRLYSLFCLPCSIAYSKGQYNRLIIALAVNVLASIIYRSVVKVLYISMYTQSCIIIMINTILHAAIGI